MQRIIYKFVRQPVPRKSFIYCAVRLFVHCDAINRYVAEKFIASPSASSLEDFADGQFHNVIAEIDDIDSHSTKRL